MSYYTSSRVDLGFEDAVEATTDALSEEGFGVLCDIDVTAKMEAKLGLDDYRQYRILGACNPPMAREALDAEPNLGVLLPCNVIVYVDDQDQTVVSAVDPETMLSVVGNDELDSVADEIGERLQRVLDSLPAA